MGRRHSVAKSSARLGHRLTLGLEVLPPVQQRDGLRLGRRAEMHVALGGGDLLVAGQLLDGLGGRTGHRQPGAEGVAEDVDAPRDLQAGPFLGPAHPLRQQPLGHLLLLPLVVPPQDPVAPEVPVLGEGGLEAGGQRDLPLAAGLRDGEVALPFGLPDHQVAAHQVHVGLLQGDDLAAAQAGVAAEDSTGRAGQSPLLVHWNQEAE